MPIDLLYIVGWVTQDSGVAYSDTLEQLIQDFTPYAKTILARYLPPEKGGYDARFFVLISLFSLQREIFDQYLPPVDANRVRSVGNIWPDCENTAIKVQAMPSGKVYPISPLPPGNGDEHQRELGGVTYTFKFYRNDSEEQRRSRVCKAIKKEAYEEGSRAAQKGETQFEEGQDFVDDRPDPGAAETILKEWFAITDSRDWNVLLCKTPGDPNSVVKERSRAKARLIAAYNIIQHPLPSGASQPFLEALLRTPDGKRKSILDSYLTRYPSEKELKTRRTKKKAQAKKVGN